MGLNKSAMKISDTSVRVLEVLKMLSSQKVSINEILVRFEELNKLSHTYTNEVILKYINTLKVFGFKFVKERDKYVLLNSILKMDLNSEELKTLCLIEQAANSIPEVKLKDDISQFLQNLEKTFSDNTKMIANEVAEESKTFPCLNYSEYSAQIKKYEKFCFEKLKLKITYNTDFGANVSSIFEPCEIIYREKEVFFRVYNPLSAQIQDIKFEDIVEINQLPQRANPVLITSSVTFRLKGRLTKAYKLHAGEKLLKVESDGSCVIINSGEDKNILLRRLLRYGEGAEIISPKQMRSEIISIIENAIKKYK